MNSTNLTSNTNNNTYTITITNTTTTTTTTSTATTASNIVANTSLNSHTNHTYQRQDFKNRRSSSEPVQDHATNRTRETIIALYNTNAQKDGISSANDDDQCNKDSGFIDCLQNISSSSSVKVRIIEI